MDYYVRKIKILIKQISFVQFPVRMIVFLVPGAARRGLNCTAPHFFLFHKFTYLPPSDNTSTFPLLNVDVLTVVFLLPIGLQGCMVRVYP